jgi:D-threo-aldose 1-dehydrogenase
MPFEPTSRQRLGHTNVAVTRLGLGMASLGGLHMPVSEDDAIATVDRAWELGVRLFDVAPLYGYGAAERRLGRALAGRPRDEYVLSTKVGRLIRTASAIPPGTDIDRQSFAGRDDAFYVHDGDVRPVFDYSADGVRRSIEESLARLGLDRVDIALVHDPDDHWAAAIDGAWPALARMRDEGIVAAIGAGMNQSAMLARFARETEMDVFLLAGRYSLLDQDGLAELLPICLERGIDVLVGGVMNSGLLAGPRPGARFDYVPAPDDLIAKARRLAEVCERHGVPLRAAAMQFPLAHPAIRALVAGARSIAQLDEYPAYLRLPIPDALWADLRSAGLLPPDAPVPSSSAATEDEPPRPAGER